MSSERTLSWAGPAPTDLRYVRRITLTSIWLGALAALLLWAGVGPRWALGFAGGAALGVANLLLLSALIREIVTLGERSRRRIVGLLAIKVPLVYGGLAALLLARIAPATAVVVGFSLVLAVIVLKAIGRLITGGETAP
jgi:hypothetical protein